MRASVLLSVVSAAGVLAQDAISVDGPLTGTLGNATVVENNPPGVAYVATLPSAAFDTAAYPEGGNVKGQIWAQARPDGIGIEFKVNFSNLPKTGGPFTYHIHAKSVPADGNCTAAAGHLDPFDRKDDPACESKLKQTCQVGDLSGKHGKVTSDPFNATYRDLFASTNPASAAFFGNLSFVLHYPNKTRITCANFELAKSAGVPSSANSSASSVHASGTGASVPSSTAVPKSYVTAAAAANSAAALGASAAGVLAALVLVL